MPVRSSAVSVARIRLDAGWYWFAGAVFLAILVAEYKGPIIGIAFAVAAASSGLIWMRQFPTPRFPSVGLWLIAIMVVGVVSAVAADLRGSLTMNIDLERDVGTAISYLIYLVIGCFFAYNKSTLRVILIAIAAAGLVISAVQLFKAGTMVSAGVSDLYLFRLEAGRGSQSQFAGLCACLILLRDEIAAKHRFAILFAAVTCTVSMLAVLGRGLMADLVILAIVVMGLTSSRRGSLVPDLSRLLVVILAAVTIAVGTYMALRVALPPVRQFIDDFFITKLLNSLHEVSGTGMETRSQIAANYRAFELEQSVHQFAEQPAFAQWLGQGWGSTVEFGFETASTKANFSRTNAPFLHNGYGNYLMKVGIAGLLLYIGFLWHLVMRAVSKQGWPDGEFAVIRRKVLLAATLVLAFGTVAGGGLGFPAIYFGLITLIGACCGPVWGPDSCDGVVDRG